MKTIYDKPIHVLTKYMTAYQKKEVIDLFYRLGFKWGSTSKSKYSYLDKYGFTNHCSGSIRTESYLMFIPEDREKNKYTVTLEELRQIVEDCEKRNSPNFYLSDLKSGMRVVFRKDCDFDFYVLNKSIYRVVNETTLELFEILSSYDNELFHKSSKFLDILEIYDENGSLIWKRFERPRKYEMTVLVTDQEAEEIRKLLGD